MKLIEAMKEMHNYIFYKFYKSINESDFGFLAQWRAIALILLMEIIISFCLIIPVNLIFDIEIFSKVFLIILVLLLVLKNYFMYDHNEKWKEIIITCNKLDKRKQRTYNIWYWIITIGLLPLLGLEFYILGKIKGTI